MPSSDRMTAGLSQQEQRRASGSELLPWVRGWAAKRMADSVISDVNARRGMVKVSDRLVATASPSGVNFIDVKNRSIVQGQIADQVPGWSMAALPHNRLAVALEDESVAIFDAQNGKWRRTLDAHDFPITTMTAVDGHLAVGYANGEVRVWSRPGGRKQQRRFGFNVPEWPDDDRGVIESLVPLARGKLIVRLGSGEVFLWFLDSDQVIDQGSTGKLFGSRVAALPNKAFALCSREGVFAYDDQANLFAETPGEVEQVVAMADGRRFVLRGYETRRGRRRTHGWVWNPWTDEVVVLEPLRVLWVAPLPNAAVVVASPQELAIVNPNDGKTTNVLPTSADRLVGLPDRFVAARFARNELQVWSRWQVFVHEDDPQAVTILDRWAKTSYPGNQYALDGWSAALWAIIAEEYADVKTPTLRLPLAEALLEATKNPAVAEEVFVTADYLAAHGRDLTPFMHAFLADIHEQDRKRLKSRLFEELRATLRRLPRDIAFDFDQLAGWFELPTIEEMGDTLSMADEAAFVRMDAEEASQAAGASEEEAEEAGMEAEQEWIDTEFRRQVEAAINVMEYDMALHGLEFATMLRGGDGQFITLDKIVIVPRVSWDDAVEHLVTTINGVGPFSYDSGHELRDDYEGSAQEAVRANLQWIGDSHRLWGHLSPRRRWERAID